MNAEEEITPCAGCGLPNIIDGPDPAAHWNTEHGHDIVAWSCSERCQKLVEQQRDELGVLPEGIAVCRKCSTGALQNEAGFWAHLIPSKDVDHVPDIPLRSTNA